MEEYNPNDDTETCAQKMYGALFESDEAFDSFFLAIGNRRDKNRICEIVGFGLRLNLEGRAEALN